MAITDRRWNRGDTNAGPLLAGVWNDYHGSVGSPITTRPWTLLRTRYQASLVVRVAAASGFDARWWVRANVRVGLKFSPDGTPPGMATNDVSPDVLAIQNLRPAFLSGDVSGSGAYAISWQQDEPLDIKTARSGAPNLLSVVYPYLWVDDPVGAFQSADPPAASWWSTQIAVLWGQ